MTMKEQHHEKNNSSIITEDYYNYYYNTHGAGRIMSPEDCERIKTAYMDNIADTMTGAVAKLIEDAFKAGLTVDEIEMAIEETGWAPRPSPQYLRAILKRWAETGVTVSKCRDECHANMAIRWWK